MLSVLDHDLEIEHRRTTHLCTSLFSLGWPLDGSSWSDSQRCDWDVKEYTALDFCGLLGPYAYLFVVFDGVLLQLFVCYFYLYCACCLCISTLFYLDGASTYRLVFFCGLGL